MLVGLSATGRLRGPTPLGLCHSVRFPLAVTHVRRVGLRSHRPMLSICLVPASRAGVALFLPRCRSQGRFIISWVPSPRTPGSPGSPVLPSAAFGPPGEEAASRPRGTTVSECVTSVRPPRGKRLVARNGGPSRDGCPPPRTVGRSRGTVWASQRKWLVPLYPPFGPAAGGLRVWGRACFRPRLHQASLR